MLDLLDIMLIFGGMLGVLVGILTIRTQRTWDFSVTFNRLPMKTGDHAVRMGVFSTLLAIFMVILAILEVPFYVKLLVLLVVSLLGTILFKNFV